LEDAVLIEQVIGGAIEVHRHLGPGLLEGIYEDCLCHELALLGIAHQRQVLLPIVYKGVQLDAAYRLDLVVEDRLVVEIKAIDRILSVHEAQLLTYLRISGHRQGLILNFNHAVLKEGIRRMTL
jgi:GxxExxY protein